MKVLALSTAEQCCSVALADGQRLIHEEFWDSRLTHSTRAMSMVENALENRAKISLDAVDAFIAAKGPGSFTGLRIGISIVQALAYSAGRQAFGMSSLDGIAYRFAHSNRPVCVMMDARRGEVYSSVYRFESGCLKNRTAEKVMSPEAAVQAAGEGAVFVGTGTLAYHDVICAGVEKYQLGNSFSTSVSASAMIRAAWEIEDFFVDGRNILAPRYIRKSDAEMQFIEKH